MLASNDNNQNQELAWVDSPLSSLLRLAWPIVVSMLSYSVMTLVDTLFVARLGTAALSGVGLGGTFAFILICFPIGVLGAVKILSSQAVGAGQRHSVQAFMGAGLVWALGLGAMAIAAGMGISALLPHAAASASAGAAAQDYLGIRVLGAMPVLIRIAIEQGRMATGDSQSPMRVALLANVTNIALDYVFIVLLGFGVAGAAWATVSANVTGCLAMVLLQAREGFALRQTRRHHVGAIWRVGLPSGLQFVLEVGSFAAMVVMLTSLSDLDGAANQLGIQIIHFGFLPCVALGDAASILVGQAVGAGRRDLVHVVARRALLPVVAYASLCTVAFAALGDQIIVRMTPDPALVAVGAQLFLVAAGFQIADAINIVARNVLRGTGDVRFCAWMGVAISWLLTPPLTWLFAYHLELGVIGGWLAILVDVYVGTAVFWLRLQLNHWHEASDASLRELAAQPA